MSGSTASSIDSFETFLASLRNYLSQESPESLADFDIYAGEAKFGRQWLEPELQRLKPGSEILEIGAGMFLLACQLQREGYAVTALEPVGSGFAHFYRLQKMVLDYAAQNQLLPKILPYPAEQLEHVNQYAFAYSLNVMEHVTDVKEVLGRVSKSLHAGGRYRFVCPNYTFPFEPHFRIPIIINKNITLYVFKNKVLHAANIEDPQSGWDSLNWISATKIRDYSMALGIIATFNREILNVYLDRALNEKGFCVRHPLIHRLISIFQGLGLLRILQYIPVAWMPVMDCVISRKENA